MRRVGEYAQSMRRVCGGYARARVGPGVAGSSRGGATRQRHAAAPRARAHRTARSAATSSSAPGRPRRISPYAWLGMVRAAARHATLSSAPAAVRKEHTYPPPLAAEMRRSVRPTRTRSSPSRALIARGSACSPLRNEPSAPPVTRSFISAAPSRHFAMNSSDLRSACSSEKRSRPPDRRPAFAPCTRGAGSRRASADRRSARSTAARGGAGGGGKKGKEGGGGGGGFPPGGGGGNLFLITT